MFKAIVVPCAIMFGAAIAHPATAANLVTNGGFEQTGFAGNFEFDSSAGNTQGGAGKLTGWSSTGGYNLLFNAATANSAAGNATGQYSYTGKEYLWASTASPNGGNFVVLDGDQSLTNRAMTQTINGLVAGQQYTLSFQWGAGQLASRTGATTDALQYSLGNETYVTPTLPNASQGFTGWNTVTRTFTATGTSEVLSFLSIGTPTGLPPVALLDGVSLTAAVPESATWAMMIVGFGAIGGALRRTRRPAVSLA